MAPHASPTRILAAARPSAVRRTRTGDAVASRPGSRARTRRSSRPRAASSDNLARELDAAAHLEALVRETTRASGEGARLHVVAFSGGVDSSLAAYLVHRAFGDGDGDGNGNGDRGVSGDGIARARRGCVAVIGVSPALPAAQLDVARDVAAAIGVELLEVPTDEGDVPEYVANEGESCLHCKNTLYSTLRAVADAAARAVGDARVPGDVPGVVSDVALYNGTNADDLTDSTRLGLLSATRYRVKSPLCALSKTRVREVARAAGLPNWNLAAAPCLRSRLAAGVPATPGTLGDVELAECDVRAILNLSPEENMRVRVLGMGTVTTGMSDTTEISGMRGMQEMQGRTGTVPVHGDETARATTRLELDPGRVAEIAGDASLRDALKGALRARGFVVTEVRSFESGSVAKRT